MSNESQGGIRSKRRRENMGKNNMVLQVKLGEQITKHTQPLCNQLRVFEIITIYLHYVIKNLQTTGVKANRF